MKAAAMPFQQLTSASRREQKRREAKPALSQIVQSDSAFLGRAFALRHRVVSARLDFGFRTWSPGPVRL